MDKTKLTPTDVNKIPESKTRPEDGLPPAVKKNEDAEKQAVEQEVKKTFKDIDVPVEPVVGNDGIEVGGEG